MNNAMVNDRLDYPSRKICWTAIFGGITVAIVLSILLSLLGTGLGFALLTPDMDSVKSLSTSAIVWLSVSSIVSMFFGGWVSSALSGDSDTTKGYWQGFIVAGISILLMLYLATCAVTSVIGGTFSALSSLNSGIKIENNIDNSNTNTANAENKNDSSQLSKDNLIQKAKDVLPESLAPMIDQISQEADVLSQSVNEQITANMPDASQVNQTAQDAKAKADELRKKIQPALQNFFTSIKTENYEQAKKDLVDVLAQTSGKSPQEIDAKVAEWQKKYEDAKAKAQEIAEKAAKKSATLISQFAFVNFFIMLISIVAAGVGGVLGARRFR